MRRVVITGIGPVCAEHRGKDSFWQMLLDQEAPVKPIPRDFEKNYTYKTRYYVPAAALKGRDSSMDEASKIALECTSLALADAGLDSLQGAAVIMGVGMGNLVNAFTSHAAHAFGTGRFNRLVIPLSMPNAAASWIALKHGADQDCFTINGACASGTMAIGEAYRKIAWGVHDTVLTGGVDFLSDPSGAVLRGFDSLKALTTAGDGLPRPFSKGRSGFLFNLGAGCALVLEELEQAKRRNAPIYAEVCGYTAFTAADSIVQMPQDYKRLLGLFKLAEDRKIDYFNAHGTGTPQNDLLEAQLIRTVWGKKKNQPLINSTKGIIGHSIGASGALEAAVTAISIKKGQAHGNLTEDLLEDLNCPPDPCELSIKYALSASYGFGGHNALLLFRRYEK